MPVVLHMPMEDLLHGAVVDCSEARLVGLPVGTVSLSTAEFKYGSKSLYCGGTGNLSIDNANPKWLDGNFTIEGWSYRPNNTGSQYLFYRRSNFAYGDTWINAQTKLVAYIALASSQSRTLTSVSDCPVGVFFHWAIDVSGTTFRMFINGVLEASTTLSARQAATTQLWTIGARYLNDIRWSGYIDDMRITAGDSLYGSDATFTPPGAISYTVPTFTTDVQELTATINPNPPVSAVLQSDVLDNTFDGARALYIGGRGRIAATVKEKAAPDLPVYRRVRLFRDRDGLMIAETWSNPVTGAYAFEYIDQSYTYSVISYDHTGNFRAVIADNLTPEPM